VVTSPEPLEGARGRFWQENAGCADATADLAMVQESYDLGQYLLQVAREYAILKVEVEQAKTPRGEDEVMSEQDTSGGSAAMESPTLSSRASSSPWDEEDEEEEAEDVVLAERIPSARHRPHRPYGKAEVARNLPSQRLLMSSVRRMQQQACLIHEGVRELRQALMSEVLLESEA